ncbi:MAG TPA: hypothetical protein P5205_11465 [Candidatus Paceibacterota bacterium]|nr:hypothetical protein [Verrucomicrobiota bacterium]HSA10976.1 hypothetical protein [Candidatus Paceibacterota bacterium]
MRVLGPIVGFLILAAERAVAGTWDGGGTNNNWTTATNWVGDVAPAPGDDLVFAPGAARLSPYNSSPAGTTFNAIISSDGAYMLDGNAIALNAGILATNGANTWLMNSVTLNSNQSFTVNFGSGHDQLNVTGAVDLASATLNASLGFTPSVGAEFVIINNDGADAVAGAFAGLPEGDYLPIGGASLRITYAGGAGHNDVVLLRTNAPPASIHSVTRLGGGQIQFQGLGGSNLDDPHAPGSESGHEPRAYQCRWRA